MYVPTPVPPLATTVILPSLLPKQLVLLIAAKLTVNAFGPVTTAIAVSVQDLESVTVTV